MVGENGISWNALIFLVGIGSWFDVGENGTAGELYQAPSPFGDTFDYLGENNFTAALHSGGYRVAVLAGAGACTLHRNRSGRAASIKGQAADTYKRSSSVPGTRGRLTADSEKKDD